MADPKKAVTTTPTTKVGDEPKKTGAKTENIDDLKAISAVGYLGILFLIPMLTNPKSEYAMFHANQSVLLLITAAIVNTVGGIIPLLGWFIILPIGNIFILVLFIMGIINALGGKMQRLPLIGKYDLIKVQD